MLLKNELRNKRLNELSERHNNNLIVENRRYFNELTSQKEEYTIEEAKEIAKKVLKKFYDSIK